jgi:phosphoglycolate phosphatase
MLCFAAVDDRRGGIGLAVFDLDGTLVDSGADIANAANALIADLGGAPLPAAEIVEMVGEGAGVLVRRSLAAAALDPDTPGALDRFLALYDLHLLDHTVPYGGIGKVLDQVRSRMPAAVLTNKPGRATARILEGLALRHHFCAVVGGDTPLGRKPDPAGLLHLASAAAVAPGRTLMVGDSRIDLQTARRAGTRICLVRYGFGFRFTPGDFRGDELFADSPGDLAALLDRI